MTIGRGDGHRGEDMTTGTTETDRARERLRRWRLVLGGGEADGTEHEPTGRDAAMDGTLAALYGKGDRARAGREAGTPAGSDRWPRGVA